MNDSFYQSILDETSTAFTYHRILLDEGGTPCDFVYLEACPAAARFVGLRPAALAGRRASETSRALLDDGGVWLARFADVALTGRPADFEASPPCFAAPCSLHVFSPQKGYFIILYRDIAPVPESVPPAGSGPGPAARLAGLADTLRTADEASAGQAVTEALRTLGDGRYAAFHRLLPDGSGFETAAVAGVSPGTLEALDALGIRLAGRRWILRSGGADRLPGLGSVVYPDAQSLAASLLPDTLSSLATALDTGEAVLTGIPAGTSSAPAGFFTLFMPPGRAFRAHDAVAALAGMTGACFDRLGALGCLGEARAELDARDKDPAGAANALAGTVFERSACALYLVGVRPDGGFVVERANRAALSGGDPDDAAGRTPAEVFGPERGERLASYFARCVREALPVVFEENLSTDGASRVFRTLLTPVVEAGRTVRLVAASGDVTSHQLSEDALRDNLRRSEILLDLLRRDDASQDAFLERTLKQAMILTDSEAGALFLLDEKQETLLPQSMLGSWYRNTSESEQPAPLSLDRAGPWAEAVRTGRPVRTTVADVPVTADGPDDAPRAANLLCLPVYDIGRVIAVLGVGNREKEYTDQTALQLAFLINNAWNVVERLRADERLRAERDLLQATLLSIGDGIVATDRDGRVLLLNDVACRMTGWGGGEAVGKPLSEVLRLIDEHTREPYVFTGQDPAVPLVAVPEDLLLVARDGTTCPVSDSVAPIRSLDGKDAGIVVAFRDVTQDRHRQESITYLSYHDPLTGLYNRRFFEEELRRLNTRRNLPITLVMADMNALKLTNDAFGHGTGDRLLRAAADALRAGCREDDIIARLGGDEFIILLPHTSYEEASTVVTRVQELCGASRVDSVALSISFGWDTKTDPAEDIQDTYRRAEDRMYRQKLFDSPGVRSHAVQTIIQALFRAQPREESHSRRVAALCETLGQALGLPDHVVRELRTAGMLYDIGKIGIREDILDKRERLTEDEQAEVRRHSEIGYRILSSVNELSEIADYILLHHERWDGSGYPKGLAGTLTPLPSRIIGLADAYDAMVSERPYRAALPPDEALRIIQDQSGTQFDPDLVKVFAERVAGRAAEQP